MSTESSASDWTAFQQFVAARPQDELAGLTLEEGVEQFRAYQRELARIREKLQLAEEQGNRGEAKPLDVDAFWARVSQRLDKLGIPE